MVRDWTTLHHTYDGLVVQPSATKPDGIVDKAQCIADLRAHLDNLYPSTRKIASAVPGSRLPDHIFHDYIVNVVCDQYTLNVRAYSVLFFLGPPPDDLAAYASH
ncbi:uncharacterized protein LY89DRAFT_734269 [Mollisia scopiformis]|uniref:Uncharacterized protein n=1 Tax=Mollisia scopiformis TaxID=149040 RepID=A0A194X7K1_MOLSC|nr:uncharacterized protein LY89DRAFT_734269 [Mollisia scopiformis]KUJ16150.1 hypothetical protein LY89DRAFT_734269 [Mollisia scopiformis]